MQRFALHFEQRRRHSIPVAVAIGVLSLAGPVLAAHGPEAEGASASRAIYRSVFDDYRAFKDEPLASWREANREVGRLGGHAGALENGGETPDPTSDEAPPAEPVRPSTTQSGDAPATMRPGPGMHRH